MVPGHLQEKNGRYYMVISLKDANGKWKPKWKATGLPVKGNKKRAEEMLRTTLLAHEAQANLLEGKSEQILFSDFLENWLESIRNSIEETTYSSYKNNIMGCICPFFKDLACTLGEIERKPQLIQEFYKFLLNERGVKATTVHRYHANLRKALQHAVKMDLIQTNPADKIDKPKAMPFHSDFYDNQQLQCLFEKSRPSKLHLLIMVAAYYGLRRSEVLGLKWSAIDFVGKSISIDHTVTMAVDAKSGHLKIVTKNRTKTQSSRRTLPLMPEIEKLLLEKQKQDQEYRRLCGRCYSKEYCEYIFVDELGNLIKPGMVTSGFPALLEKNGLPRIRFHDLRHSCASLLLNNGVEMKAIQEWLGHSNFSTTANIYAHLDVKSKEKSGRVLENILSGNQGVLEPSNT